jgi:hypothetical protein
MCTADMNELFASATNPPSSARSCCAYCAACAGGTEPARDCSACCAAPAKCSALPIDWLVSLLTRGVTRWPAGTCATAAGRSSRAATCAGVSAPRWPRNETATIEPRIATPNAPATWRTVLFTADPAPDFSRGTALMIASVAGDIVNPMPRPNPTSTSSMVQIGIVWVARR